MADSIYLKKPGGFMKMSNQPYETEYVLQQLLTDYPDLLAGEQMPGSEPRRWLLVTPEASIPDTEGGSGRWAVDHLFLDQDAIPTLVEVKRATDTRIRREVVAQMLEYAANGVIYWPIQDIISMFEATSQAAGKEPREELLQFLGEEQGDVDPVERFWDRVRTNLAAGRMRLVFVADIIPGELRRIVEFLNEQMSRTEVIAVEIKQYVSDDHSVLVPRVIGQTERAKAAKSSTGGAGVAWGEEEFALHLRESLGNQPPCSTWGLYEWAREHLTPDYGHGRDAPIFQPYYEAGGVRYAPFRLSWEGGIQIAFTNVRRKPPFDQPDARLEYLRLLNLIPGVDIPVEKNDKEPNLPRGAIADAKAFDLFREAIEWFVETVDRYWTDQAGRGNSA